MERKRGNPNNTREAEALSFRFDAGSSIPMISNSGPMALVQVLSFSAPVGVRLHRFLDAAPDRVNQRRHDVHLNRDDVPR
jgi:hypothetical protein